MPVTNYDPIGTRAGRAGHIRTSSGHHHRISRHVGGQVQEVRSATVDAAADATPYTLTLAGKVKTINSGAGASKNSIANQLIDAINLDPALFEAFFAVEHPDTDDVLLVFARQPGVAFAMTVGANLTAALVTAADAGAVIPPGVAVCQDATDPQGAVLPSKTTTPATAQTTHLTPGNLTATEVMSVVVLADADGDGIPESYESAAALDADPLMAEATAALQADLDGQLPESFIVTEDGTKVVITGPAGLVFEVRARAFTADGAPGLTTLTLAQPANASPEVAGLAGRFLGFVILEQKAELPEGGGQIAYEVGDMLTVGQVDELDILLDDDAVVADGDAVFIRAVAGAGQQRGACRPDADGGNCLAVPNARFTGPSFIGLDGLNCAPALVWRG